MTNNKPDPNQILAKLGYGASLQQDISDSDSEELQQTEKANTTGKKTNPASKLILQEDYPSNEEVKQSDFKPAKISQGINDGATELEGTFGSIFKQINKSPLSAKQQFNSEFNSKLVVESFDQQNKVKLEQAKRESLEIKNRFVSADIDDLQDSQSIAQVPKKQKSWNTDDQKQELSKFKQSNQTHSKEHLTKFFNKALTQKDRSSSSGKFLTEGSEPRDPKDKVNDEEKREEFKAQPQSDQLSDMPHLIGSKLSNAALSMQEPGESLCKTYGISAKFKSAQRLGPRANSKAARSSGTMNNSRRGRGISYHNRTINEESFCDKAMCSSGKESHDATAEVQELQQISDINYEGHSSELASVQAVVGPIIQGKPQNSEQLLDMLLEAAPDFKLQVLSKDGHKVTIDLQEVNEWKQVNSIARQIEDKRQPQKEKDSERDKSVVSDLAKRDEGYQELDVEREFKQKQQKALQDKDKRENLLNKLQKDLAKAPIKEESFGLSGSDDESDIGHKSTDDSKQKKPKGIDELIKKMSYIQNVKKAESRVEKSIDLESSSQSDDQQAQVRKSEIQMSKGFQKMIQGLQNINQKQKASSIVGDKVIHGLARHSTELSVEWQGIEMSEGNPSQVLAGSSNQVKSSGSSLQFPPSSKLNKNSSVQSGSILASNPSSGAAPLMVPCLNKIEEGSERIESESSTQKRKISIVQIETSSKTASFPSVNNDNRQTFRQTYPQKSNILEQFDNVDIADSASLNSSESSHSKKEQPVQGQKQDLGQFLKNLQEKKKEQAQRDQQNQEQIKEEESHEFDLCMDDQDNLPRMSTVQVADKQWFNHKGNINRFYSEGPGMAFGTGYLQHNQDIHNLEDKPSMIGDNQTEVELRNPQSAAHSSSLDTAKLISFAPGSKQTSSYAYSNQPSVGSFGPKNKQNSLDPSLESVGQRINKHPYWNLLTAPDRTYLEKATKPVLHDLVCDTLQNNQQLKYGIENLCQYMVRHKFVQKMHSEELIKMAMRQNENFNKQLHFTFLFASPRYLKIGTYSEAYGKIDYTNEWDKLKNDLINQKIKILFMRSQATIESLKQSFMLGSTCIHISAHGERNSELKKKMDKAKSNAYKSELLDDKGDLLLLEDENGMFQALYVKELEKILDQAKMLESTNFNKVQLVFLACCHSENMGWMFHKAGVPHVICSKESEKISNEAQNFFTSRFYMLLFKERMSVCQAFYVAIDQLKNHNNEQIRYQFDKYIIIRPREQRDKGFYSRVKDQSTVQKCGCGSIGEWEQGSAKDYNDEPLFKINQPREEIHQREQEIDCIHKKINESRLVVLRSIKGMGKNLIAYKIAFEFQERKRFHKGVISIDKRYTNESLASLLIQKIKQSGSDIYINMLREKKQQMDHNQQNQDIEQLKYVIKDMELFVVVMLDDCSLENDTLLRQHLSELLETTKQLRFLVTTGNCEQIEPLHQIQSEFNLERLNKKQTVAMFFEISKKHWPKEQLNQQFLVLVASDQAIKKRIGDHSVLDMARDKLYEFLGDHPFFDHSMAGFPQSIKQVSGMLSKDKSLEELIQFLSNIAKNKSMLELKGHEHLPLFRSLLSSLEDVRSHFGQQPIIFYLLISLMPGGVSQNDFKKLKTNCAIFTPQCNFESNIGILETRCIIKQRLKIREESEVAFQSDKKEDRRYTVQTMAVPFKSKETYKIFLQLKEGIQLFYRNMVLELFGKLGVIQQNMQPYDEDKAKFELIKIHKDNIIESINFSINPELESIPSKTSSSQIRSQQSKSSLHGSKSPIDGSPKRIKKIDHSQLTSANPTGLSNLSKTMHKKPRLKQQDNTSFGQKDQISTKDSSIELPSLFEIVDTQSIIESSQFGDSSSHVQSNFFSGSEIGTDSEFEPLMFEMQEPSRGRRNTSIQKQRFSQGKDIIEFQKRNKMPQSRMFHDSPTKQSNQQDLVLKSSTVQLNGLTLFKTNLLSKRQATDRFDQQESAADKSFEQSNEKIDAQDEVESMNLPQLAKTRSKSQQGLKLYQSPSKQDKKAVEIQLDKVDSTLKRKSKSPNYNKQKHLAVKAMSSQYKSRQSKSPQGQDKKTYDFGNLNTPMGDYSRYDKHKEYVLRVKTKACDEDWSIYKFPIAADLVYFYLCDLILLKKYSDAQNILEYDNLNEITDQHDKQMSRVFKANILKMQALVAHLLGLKVKDSDIHKARGIFKEHKIVHGVALCSFFEAYLMINRLEKQCDWKPNKQQDYRKKLKKAMDLSQEAILNYKMIDHLFGQSVSIELKLKIQKQHKAIFQDDIKTEDELKLQNERHRLEKVLSKRLKNGRSRFLWRNSDFLSVMMEVSFISMPTSLYQEKLDPEKSLWPKKKNFKDKYFKCDLLIQSDVRNTFVPKNPQEWKLLVSFQSKALRLYIGDLIDRVSFSYPGQKYGEKDVKTRHPFETSGLFKQDLLVEINVAWNKRIGPGLFVVNNEEQRFKDKLLLKHRVVSQKWEATHVILFQEDAIKKLIGLKEYNKLPNEFKKVKISSPQIKADQDHLEIEESKQFSKDVSVGSDFSHRSQNSKQAKRQGRLKPITNKQQTLFDADESNKFKDYQPKERRSSPVTVTPATDKRDGKFSQQNTGVKAMPRIPPIIPQLEKVQSPIPENLADQGYQASVDDRSQLIGQSVESLSEFIPPLLKPTKNSEVSELSQPQDMLYNAQQMSKFVLKEEEEVKTGPLIVKPLQQQQHQELKQRRGTLVLKSKDIDEESLDIDERSEVEEPIEEQIEQKEMAKEEEQEQIIERMDLMSRSSDQEEIEHDPSASQSSDSQHRMDIVAYQLKGHTDEELDLRSNVSEEAQDFWGQDTQVPKIEVQAFDHEEGLDMDGLNERASFQEEEDDEDCWDRELDKQKQEEYDEIALQIQDREEQQQQMDLTLIEQAALSIAEMANKGSPSSKTPSSIGQVISKSHDTEETFQTISQQDFRLGNISELGLRKQTSTEEQRQQEMSETTEKLKVVHERSKSAMASKESFDFYDSFNSKSTSLAVQPPQIVESECWDCSRQRQIVESKKPEESARALSPQLVPKKALIQTEEESMSDEMQVSDEILQEAVVTKPGYLDGPISDKNRVKSGTSTSKSNSTNSVLDRQSRKNYKESRKRINDELFEANKLHYQTSVDKEQDQMFYEAANFEDMLDEIRKQTEAKETSSSMVEVAKATASLVSDMSTESQPSDNKVMFGGKKRKKMAINQGKKKAAPKSGPVYMQRALSSIYDKPNLTDQSQDSLLNEEFLDNMVSNEEEFGLQHALLISSKESSNVKQAILFELKEVNDLVQLTLVNENRNALCNIISHADFIESQKSQLIINTAEVKKGSDRLIMDASPPLQLSLFFKELTGRYSFPEKMEFEGQVARFEVEFEQEKLKRALKTKPIVRQNSDNKDGQWQFTQSSAKKYFQASDFGHQADVQPQDMMGNFDLQLTKGVYLNVDQKELQMQQQEEAGGQKEKMVLHIQPGQGITDENKQIIKTLHELYVGEKDPRERNNYKQQLLSHMEKEGIKYSFKKLPSNPSVKEVPAQQSYAQIATNDSSSFDMSQRLYDIQPSNVPVSGQAYRHRQQEMAAKFRWRNQNKIHKARLRINQIGRQGGFEQVEETKEENSSQEDSSEEHKSLERAIPAKNVVFDDSEAALNKYQKASKGKLKNSLKQSNASLGNSSKRSKSISDVSQSSGKTTPISEKKALGIAKRGSVTSFGEQLTKDNKKKQRTARKRASQVKRQDSFVEPISYHDEQEQPSRVKVPQMKKERSRSASESDRKDPSVQVLEEVKASEKWAQQKLQKPKTQGLIGQLGKGIKSLASNMFGSGAAAQKNSASPSQLIPPVKSQAVFGKVATPQIQARATIAVANIQKGKYPNRLQVQARKDNRFSMMEQNSSSSQASSSAKSKDTKHGIFVFPQEMYDEVKKMLRAKDRQFHKSVQKHAKWIAKDRVQIKEKVVIALGQADLTVEATDALVNPTNIFMQHRAGLSGQLLNIWPGLKEVSQNIINKTGSRSIRQGSCEVTEAGDLNMKYLLHTPGPIWKSYKDNPKRGVQLLSECIKNCLNKARDLQDVQTVSFPAISGGNNGGHPEIVAQIMFRNMFEWCEKPPSGDNGILKEIRIRQPDYEGHRQFQEVMKELFQEAPGFQDVMIEYEKQRSDSSCKSEVFEGDFPDFENEDN